MDVTQCSTPNKSAKGRMTKDITLAVIHYTGSENEQGAVSWFKNPDAKVSAHYVIARNGEVFQFETITAKLWHAGDSTWQGCKWCNGYSIGYEICGTYESGFTEEQYDSLRQLLLKDVESTAIDSIVGHEHIAPGRKIDPGPNFDWDRVRDWFDIDDHMKFIGGVPFVSKPEELAEEKEVVLAPNAGFSLEEVTVEINSGISEEEEKEEKRETATGFASFIVSIIKMLEKLF